MADDDDLIGAPIDHSLGYLQDLLHFGIPERKHPTDTMVWGAFVRIAMSAQRRGWGQIEFENEVTAERKMKGRWRKHKLWVQHTELNRTPERSLDKAWQQAALHLRGEGLSTCEDIADQAVETALHWEDRLTSGVDGLDDIDILVMDYVIVWTQKRRYAQVTCPKREVGLHAGVHENVAIYRLKRLAKRGLLVRYSTGYAAKKKLNDEGKWEPCGGRAAIYCLTDPFTGGSP